MKEVNAVFAGETSGHFFFNDRFYGFDDGIYSAIRIINIVSKSSLSMSEINQSIPDGFIMPEEKIPVSAKMKEEIIQKLSKKLRDDGFHFLDIDGVRVDTDSGWWLIRASQTQDVIVVRCEGITETDKIKMQKQMIEYLKIASNNELDLNKIIPVDNIKISNTVTELN